MVFEWAELVRGKWPEMALMHHIPNGGSRNPIEAVHLKEQGVKAGVPDIFLPVARAGYHGLYIEMKRRRFSRVTTEQREMIQRLRAQGYRVEVCKGFEVAKSVIGKYMTDSCDKKELDGDEDV